MADDKKVGSDEPVMGPDNIGEVVAEGIWHRVTEDGIHVYTVTTMTWEPLEKWLEAVVRLVEGAPKDSVLRIVFDISRVRIFKVSSSLRYGAGGEYNAVDVTTLGFTWELNGKIRAVLVDNPSFKVFLALVLSTRWSAQITRVSDQPGILYQRKLFGDLGSGIAWLKGVEKPK